MKELHMPKQIMTISNENGVNNRGCHLRRPAEIVNTTASPWRITNITRELERCMTFVFVTVALVFLIAPTAWSQATSGTLTGQIVDPTGAVIPGASVTVTDTRHGTSFTVITSGEGLFTRT